MKPSRKLLFVLVPLCLLACALGAAVLTGTTSHAAPSPASPPVVPAPGSALDAATLERMGVRFAPAARTASAHAIDVVGVLDLNRERVAQVSTHAAGRAVRIEAAVGRRVARGAVLAWVESTAIGEARAEYIVRQAEGHSARQNGARLAELDARGLTTAREREVAEAQLRTAEAGIEAARTRLRAFGVLPDSADARAGRAPLVSPIGGVVIARDILLGGWVQPEAEAFTVADLSTLWADFDVYESDLGAVSVGDAVLVDVPALGVQSIPGEVQFVYPELDRATRMGKVRVVVPNQNERLRAGLSVSGHIRPRVAIASLRVPREAVRERDGRIEVLVRRGAQALWHPVRTGPRGEREVEVLDGLTEGEIVAVAGLALVSGEL